MANSEWPSYVLRATCCVLRVAWEAIRSRCCHSERSEESPLPASDDSRSPTRMWGWGGGTMRVLEVRGRRDVDQDVARVLETGR